MKNGNLTAYSGVDGGRPLRAGSNLTPPKNIGKGVPRTGTKPGGRAKRSKTTSGGSRKGHMSY